jgi:hypothetical protein
MKAIRRFGTVAAAFALLSTLAIAASKAERANKYFTLTGTVLQIDKTERTLLVADRASNRTYLIEVQEGARFKIVFGRYMQVREPGFQDVNVREQIEIRCFRGDTEHLALLDNKLDNGQPVVAVTATQ